MLNGSKENFQVEKDKLVKQMAGEIDLLPPEPQPAMQEEESDHEIDEAEMRKFVLLLQCISYVNCDCSHAFPIDAMLAITVLAEIAERKQFMDELEAMGQLKDFHRSKIITEISQVRHLSLSTSCRHRLLICSDCQRVSRLERLHRQQ